MKLERARLRDLLEPFEELLGSRPEPELLTLTEKNGFMAQSAKYNKRVARDDTSDYKIIRKFDIAFNPYLLWAGAIAQNVGWEMGLISPLYPTFRIRDGFDPRFVDYLLGGESLRLRYDTISFGSIPRKRRSSVTDFLNLEIPKPPPLPSQRRIAAILDHVEVLRAKRRHALAKLDALTQSLFLDLFGNPIRNERKWPLAPLREMGSVERGKFTPRPRGDPSYYHGSFPFIQTGDISSSGGRLNTWGQTLNEKGIKVSRKFPPGTVVIAIVGATLGITAILEIEVYCPDSVVGIQPYTSKASAEYIEWILRFWRPIFVAQAPETARANINLETLRPLQVPLPPVDLQREFATRVTAVEKLKTTQRASLAKLDALFTTLQHRAFRGEL